MKAVVVHDWGPAKDLVPEETDRPQPGDDDVLVKVTAAGVGYVDALMIQGEYQIRPPLPFVGGMEFAGVVDQVGTGVTEVSIGDRVTGSGSGSLAEYMTVRASACRAIPETLSDVEAAGFWVNHLTAVCGLDYVGEVQPGETVLILGAAGGVGSSAISVARAMGAHVIAGASTQAKRDFCVEVGADEVVDTSTLAWRDELKERYPRGIDVAYDPVGGDDTEMALRSMAARGRLLIVGFASGTIPAPKLNLALLKRCSIRGVNWGGESAASADVERRVTEKLLELVATPAFKVAPTTTYSLDETGAALQSMLDRQALGKVVIVP